MEVFSDTQALFAQLAGIPEPQAVKTLIENHDAWTHADTLSAVRLAWARLEFQPRDPAHRARLNRQRHALKPLLTILPVRYANAG
jgi:hypothetical protein